MLRTSSIRAGVIALVAAVLLALVIWIWSDDGRPVGWMLIEWISASLAFGGVYLFISGFVNSQRQRAGMSDELPQVVQGAATRKLLTVARHRSVRLRPMLPDFGMYCGCILGILMFCFMLDGRRGVEYGLKIQLQNPPLTKSEQSPQSETLGVYVGPDRRFYVNGQPIERDQLRATLQKQLDRRVVWTVYFEADDNCRYADVIYAFDTIRGAGGQVFWITPQVRRELNQQSFEARHRP